VREGTNPERTERPPPLKKRRKKLTEKGLPHASICDDMANVGDAAVAIEERCACV
jgi:hypothetical protein